MIASHEERGCSDSLPATEFLNPITGTCYRLRDDPSGWRVTKVVQQDGAVIVRHLRGTHADGVQPSAAAVDRLVRGDHQDAAAPMSADAGITYAEAVLVDLDRVSSVMTALAADARERRMAGIPGFRAGCSHLRQQESKSLSVAVEACRRMAAAWRSSGLADTPGLVGLPDWLVAAMDDLHETGQLDA